MVAVVAGYTLFEMAFLLSMIAAHNDSTMNSYLAFALFGQLLTIPGTAVILSRLMCGPRRWVRRTLAIFLIGSLGVPVAVTLILIPILLLPEAAVVSWIFFAVLLFIAFAIIAAALLFVRKLEKRSAAAQAKKWLAERQVGIDSEDRKWSSRGIRFAVCIPSIFVLAVFPFLPEICGILTHLGKPQAGSLSGYQVEIPSTWIILGHNNRHTEGRYQVSGFVNKGIGRGMNPFQYRELSYWYIIARSILLRKNGNLIPAG